MNRWLDGIALPLPLYFGCISQKAMGVSSTLRPPQHCSAKEAADRVAEPVDDPVPKAARTVPQGTHDLVEASHLGPLLLIAAGRAYDGRG